RVRGGARSLRHQSRQPLPGDGGHVGDAGAPRAAPPRGTRAAERDRRGRALPGEVSMESERRGPAAAAALVVPLALSAWVYFPIAPASFWADAFVCLASIPTDGFLRFVLRPFGAHNLLLRNLVFSLSYRLFGLRAELYFWTVLLTHLLNVFLLFR